MRGYDRCKKQKMLKEIVEKGSRFSGAGAGAGFTVASVSC